MDKMQERQMQAIVVEAWWNDTKNCKARIEGQ